MSNAVLERLTPAFATRRSLSFGSALVVAAAVIGMRIWSLGAHDLWADELTTLQATDGSWRDLFAFVVSDVVHPPLFYIFAKAWVDVGGDSVWWLRLLPTIFGIAATVPFVLICRELLLGSGATLLASLLFAVNGYLVYYSNEFRMYSLLLLLTLSSAWLFVRLLKGKSSRRVGSVVPLFCVNLLLVFTHYYGWTVVGVELLSVLLWKRREIRSFGLSLVGLLALFAPWAYAATRAVRDKGGLSENLDWAWRPRILDVVGYYGDLSGAIHVDRYRWVTAVAAFVTAVVVARLAIRKLRGVSARMPSDGDGAVWFFLLLAVLPVAASSALSRILPYSIWHPRYLIVSAAAYLLLVVVGVKELGSGWIAISSALALSTWALLSGVVEHYRTDRVAWSTVAEKVVAAEAASSRLYTIGGQDFSFYLDRIAPGKFHLFRANGVDDLQGHRFWILLRVSGDRYRLANDSPERRERERLRALNARLVERGYVVRTMIKNGAVGYRAFALSVAKSGRELAHTPARTVG